MTTGIIVLRNGIFTSLTSREYAHYKGKSEPDESNNLNLSVWIEGEEDIENEFILEVWEQLAEMLLYKYNYRLFSIYHWYKMQRTMHKEGDVYLMRWSDKVFSDSNLLMTFLKSWHEVYIKKPVRQESSSFYFKIFPAVIWICVLVIFLLIPCFIYSFCCLYKKFDLQRRLHQFWDDMFYGVTAFANQGIAESPGMLSFRLLSASILMFWFLIWVCYSSLLVAYLSISFAPMPFSNLDELIQQNTYQICVQNQSYAMLEMSTPDRTALLPKWKGHLNGAGCPKDIYNLLKAACTNKVVVLIDSQHKDIRFGNCKIVPLGPTYFSGDVFLSTSYRFKSTHDVNQALMKLWNFGILNHIRKNHFKPLSKDEDLLYLPVTFKHVYEVVIAYALCMCLCLFILFIELYVHSRFDKTTDTDNEPNIPYYN